MDVDLDNAIAITREIYWVGFAERITRLRCNPYILRDSNSEDVVLFDPGSISDFPKIMRKIIDVVPVESISLVVVSHQDPDVCGNTAVVEDVIARADLQIAAHINTVRLIDHLGLASEFYRVDENDYKFKLSSGRILEFIHLPFLHSPGAIATFDRETKTLFSGDLFGAVSPSENLFKDPDFPSNMDSFHQAYMPSNAILRRGLRRLESLPIERILPQHGSIIEGSDVQAAFEHLRELPCGLDLDEGEAE